MTFGGGGVSWGPEVINSSLKNMEKLNFIYFSGSSVFQKWIARP